MFCINIKNIKYFLATMAFWETGSSLSLKLITVKVKNVPSAIVHYV
jgi:hypothetical protein